MTIISGHIHEICAVTTATVRAMKESARKQQQEQQRRSVVCWTGSTENNQHPVVVKRRLDGLMASGEQKILTSLFVFNKQKCMLHQGKDIPVETGIKNIIIYNNKDNSNNVTNKQ